MCSCKPKLATLVVAEDLAHALIARVPCDVVAAHLDVDLMVLIAVAKTNLIDFFVDGGVVGWVGNVAVLGVNNRCCGGSVVSGADGVGPPRWIAQRRAQCPLQVRQMP